MRRALAIAALWLTACNSAPAPAPDTKAAAPPPAPVKDDTALLLDAHRTAAQVVPDHILGIAAMPGGSIGDYDDHGKKYQVFIVEADSPDNAAFLLLDMKAAMTNPAYLAQMGGYFGTRDGKGLYVFAKAKYLAGVVGLDKDAADPIAREQAAQLR